jgi:hypothetical protein
MPKEDNKKIKKDKKLIDVEELEQEMKEEEDEELSDDVQEALGMNKAERAAKIREVDYIAELENISDDSESSDKDFSEDFGTDYD